MTKDSLTPTMQKLILALVVAFVVWVGGSVVVLFQHATTNAANIDSLNGRMTENITSLNGRLTEIRTTLNRIEDQLARYAERCQ